MDKRKKLVFENGREFFGYSFGADTSVVSEVVFCTSMIGYQEILSDTSYAKKIVLFTYPVIGSYGLSDEDYESSSLSVSAVIVREYNDFPSNFRYTKTLAEEMQECNVPGIYGVDTREITQMLRVEGTMRAALVDDTFTDEEVKNLFIKNTGTVLLVEVSSKKIWYSRTANYRYNVVALDCGISNSVIRSLKQRGCNVIVVPYDLSEERILSLRPQGLVISDGPGFPSDATIVVNTVKNLIGTIPILGIGFGFLAIASTFGVDIVRLKTQHYGSNHPVINTSTMKIETVTQSHSFTINEDSLATKPLAITHRNLIDNSIEGIALREKSVIGTQFHPETTIDGKDSAYIYDEFIADIIEATSRKEDIYA